MISVRKMKNMPLIVLLLLQAEIHDYSGRKSLYHREVYGTAHSSRLRLLNFRKHHMTPKTSNTQSSKFSIETLVRTEEKLLSAILKYVLKDKAEAIAGGLLRTFKTFGKVLSADFEKLRNVPGMNANSAILLKLVDRCCHQRTGNNVSETEEPAKASQVQRKEKQKTSSDKESQEPVSLALNDDIQEPSEDRVSQASGNLAQSDAKKKTAADQASPKAKSSKRPAVIKAPKTSGASSEPEVKQKSITSEALLKAERKFESVAPEALPEPEVKQESESSAALSKPEMSRKPEAPETIPAPEAKIEPAASEASPAALSLSDAKHFEIADAIPSYPEKQAAEQQPLDAETPPRKVTMFSKAILKEGIALLPSFPDTESVPEINEYLRNNLHFSAEATRKRYAGYITGRIFYRGVADKALRYFARKYQGRSELKEVCFFRFCKAEPLVTDVINELLLPAIGTAKLDRENLRGYLVKRFGDTNYAKGCGQAIVEAMTSGGIAKADKKAVYFEFRDVLIPSFAFIIHDEFPEFGMYDISKVESGRNLKVMLWNPDRIHPALYELRNRNLLSKVSEIDSVRQFTMKMTLEELVEKV